MDNRLSKLVKIFNAQSEKAIKDNGKTWDQLEALNHFHSIGAELTTAQILMGFFLFNTSINIKSFNIGLTYDELKDISLGMFLLFDDKMNMIIKEKVTPKPLESIDYSNITESDLGKIYGLYFDIETYEITNFEPETSSYFILNFQKILTVENRVICYFIDPKTNNTSFVVIHYNEYTKEATNIELSDNISNFVDMYLFDDFIDILNEDNIILSVLNNESEGKSKFPEFTYNGKTPENITTVPQAYVFFWYFKFVCKFGDNWHPDDSLPTDENGNSYFSELDTEIYEAFVDDVFALGETEFKKYGYEDVYDLYSTLRDYEPSTINEII